MKYIFILIICTSFFTLNPQGKWKKTNGPEGGAVSGIVTKGDTIILGVGFFKGIIFYSFDRGVRWNKSNFKISFPSGYPASINDFIFAEDGSVLAACGKHGIYKSFDLNNWQNILQNSDNSSLGKDYLGNIYGGTIIGNILISTDQGINWSVSFSGTYNHSITTFVNTQDSILFAGTLKQLLRKKKNSNWEIIPLSTINQFYDPALDDTNNIYANSNSRIFKSIDKGNTWISLDTNHFFIGGNYIYNIIINNRMIAACGDETYAFGNGWGIALSDDGGLTWRWQNNGLPPRLASANRLAKSGQDTYVTLNAAGVYKSTNFGDSWFSANNGLHAAEVLDITFDKEGILYAASWSNGIFKSTDKGETWQKKNNGLTNSYLYSIVADTNGNLIAGTDEGFFRSTDKGESWVPGSQLGNNYFYKLCVDKRNRIYTVQFNSGIYRTSNLGVNWQKIDNGFSNSEITTLTIDNSGNLYAGTYLGYIYKSSNDGMTWTQLRSTPYLTNSIIEGIVITPNGHIFAANTSEGVLRSTDSGVTWVNKANSLPNYVMTCLTANQNGELYLSTKADKLHYSSDDGETWIDVTSNLAQTWVRDMTFDEQGNLFLATDESVWMTKDPTPVELINFTSSVKGNYVNLNWATATEINNSGFYIERNTADSSTWSNIAFINGQGTTAEKTIYSYTDKNLPSGKYNYRLKQTDYNGSYKYYNLLNEVIINIPSEYRLEQNYPNPFNPSTTIKYQIPKEGRVTLRLYDLLGSEISTLIDENKAPGTYEFQFNAANLSSGVYFYRLQAGSFNQIKKMILIR